MGGGGGGGAVLHGSQPAWHTDELPGRSASLPGGNHFPKPPYSGENTALWERHALAPLL